jgi:hypothetical protein
MIWKVCPHTWCLTADSLLYTYHINSKRKPVSIPSRPELRPEPVEGRSEGRIEGCGKCNESCRTRTLRYALHFIPRYSRCYSNHEVCSTIECSATRMRPTGKYAEMSALPRPTPIILSLQAVCPANSYTI